MYKMGEKDNKVGKKQTVRREMKKMSSYWPYTLYGRK